MEQAGDRNEAAAQAGNEGLYAIQAIPGKGQGLIATSRILKGTRILSEAPLFKVPRNTSDLKVVNDLIVKAVKGLDKAQQRAFLSLHNAHGRDKQPFLGISRTNALPLGSEAREGAIFLEASRINHACRHNAQNTWNENIRRLTIHAVRDIEEGEEITISYLGATSDYAERQAFLKRTFFFDCGCELCSLPPAQRAESDLRLRKIQFIDNTIASLGDSMSEYKDALHLVNAMFRLFKEEGVWDASIPRAYYDAFQIAVANGDDTRAKVFAERAHAARVIVEGDDSPVAARLKQLAANPRRHPAYGLVVGVPQRVELPSELDGPAFEDWLWREDESSDDDDEDW
ncbi:set domain-containing 5 [Trichoderma arundinaceum]|uniref:Set domain-containing 5 n=1 Tax=Trichoderma arundinaceum TaxID=490622 RepID=A0A395NP96_TRIAR|nr:set domain-containing 5 [Trichoderma arundinaceum]